MSTRSVLAMLLLLSSAGLAACGQKPEAPKSVAAPQGALTVNSAQVDDLKPVAATMTSYKMAEATARIAGTLTSLNVKEGDEVKKGQLIGWVQDSRIAPQTAAYAASAVAAEAQAAQAQAQYNRVKTLYDKGIYAKAALDQAEAAWKAAAADVKAARAQTAANAAYGDQGAVYAPDAGKVLTADVPKGAVVMAGQTIASLTSGAPVVRIELPEGQSRMLAVGQTIRLEADGREGTGAITRIYPSVTQGQVEADVTPAGFETLPVGARLTAWVSLGKRQAVLLPRTYVVTRYGLDYVTLVQADGTRLETTVETAPYDAQHIEILGGLNPGDRVVAYGAR